MGMTEIRTGRLVLKKLKESDIPTLVSEIGNWEVTKWLSSVPHPYTQDDARYWLERASKNKAKLSIFKENVLIGGVGLTQDDGGYYELGYWLGESNWRNGYATEAARSLLHYAKGTLHYKKFKSSYMVGNDGSAKVLNKLGFKTIGESEVYCLSRKETVPSIKLVLE